MRTKGHQRAPQWQGSQLQRQVDKEVNPMARALPSDEHHSDFLASLGTHPLVCVVW